MWNKSIDTRQKGTLILSQNPELLTWFQTHFPDTITINTQNMTDNQFLFSSNFKTIIYDIDTDKDLKVSTMILSRYPISSKIALSRRYNSKTALELFRKGTTHFLLFPTKKEQIKHILYSENHFSNDYHKMELIFSMLIKNTPFPFQKDTQILFTDTIEEKDKESIFKSKALLTKLLLTTTEKNNTKPSGEELLSIFPLRLIEFPDNRRWIKTYLNESVGTDTYTRLIKSNPTILIVEDEPIFRESLAKHLERFTENVITAESAQEALEKTVNLTQLDIKILDIDLPGENGITLLPKLNHRFPDSQTIMVTAYDDITYVNQSFQNHVFDYIVKPVELQLLINKISRAIQIKGLKRLLHSLSSSIFPNISHNERLLCMKQLIQQQHGQHIPIYMEDIYFLFPECITSDISPTQEIPLEILEDGIGLLINALLYQIQKGESCQIIFDDWRYFILSLEEA